MNSYLRPVLACAVVAACVVAFSVSPHGAPLIQIQSPASGVRLPAGPDYATDVLGDPWDMSNPEDIGVNPLETGGFTNFAVANGLAGGTIAAVGGAADSAVTFLHRGYWGILNPGRNGRNFPIDTTKYRKLAFRMNSAIAGEIPQIYWFHHPWTDPADAGPGMRTAETTVAGAKIYVSDLTQSNQGDSWTNGVVRGFRIDPNNHSVGYDVFFDWVRITAADGAADATMLPIQWTGASTATLQVVDASSTVLTIATGVSSPYSWNYGVLPPGNYTLVVTSGSAQTTTPFSINNPPIVRVTAPSLTSGDDYAQTVLANAWDMSTSSDVQVTDGIGSISFDGAMHGINTTSDPKIVLLGPSNNTVPIDTSKYRYLTYRFQLDGPFDMAGGSVARLFWTSAPNLDGNTATTTKDILIWPGMNSYTIDLAALSAAPDGGLESTSAAEIWTAANKRVFRFDPDEFSTARTFHLDDVKLTAKPLSYGTYSITFAGSDADGDATTVTLYWDNDRDPFNGKTKIASVALSAGQYAWNTAAVPPGEYYIYAEANDGIQTTGRYSESIVQVSTPAMLAEPTMSVDSPQYGTSVTEPFVLGGWAIDRAAPSGTGVDTVHVYAQPATGSAIFVGVAQYGGVRNDLGAAFGPQFTYSGYNLNVSGLAPGSYTFTAYAHSTFTGTFNQARSVAVTIEAATSRPVLSLDSPASGTVVAQPFVVGGWAIDRGAAAGTGVTAVHVYAYPNPGSGAAPVFLGAAAYGGSRADVGAIFGPAFTNSGFGLAVSGLAPGQYQIAVYALSSVTGTFNSSRSATITIPAPVTTPVMSIDTPQSGSHAGSSFNIGGWAADLGAATGTGVDAVHVWGYPSAGSPFFAGVASYGIARPDVGGVFGGRFSNSGYGLAVSGLAPGTYDFVVFAHSTVTGTFNQSRTVRVIVP